MANDVETAIKEYAKEHGYTGLYNSDFECGCLIDDIAPCDNNCASCKFGYWTECKDCEDIETCEFHNIDGVEGCVRAKQTIKIKGGKANAS